MELLRLVLQGREIDDNFLSWLPFSESKSLDSVKEGIPLYTDLSRVLLKGMKHQLRFTPEIDKLCVLMFGRMNLKKGLNYDPIGDNILGYEDVCGRRFSTFAEQAVVFMARGLVSKLNQPVALHLTRNMNESDLKKAVKDSVVALQDVGLKVVAIVSDSAESNVSVLESLATVTEGDNVVIEIGGQKIFVFVDSHHLRRDLRDNFLTYDIQFQYSDRQINVAKFEILKYFLEAQENNVSYLTPYVFPAAIISKGDGLDAEIKEKMNFELAALLFSYELSGEMHRFYRETANIDALYFSNFLHAASFSFDSFIEGKFSGKFVKDNSKHHTLWNISVQIMQDWRFVSRSPGAIQPQTKCFQLWRRNLVNAQALWKDVSALGVKRFKISNLNLDLLQNSFDLTKQQGRKTEKPTCKSFLIQFRTLCVNSALTGLTSRPWNIKENIASLSDMRNFISKENSNSQNTSDQSLTAFGCQSSVVKNEVEVCTKWIQELSSIMETDGSFGPIPTFLISYFQEKVNSDFISACFSCYNSVYLCDHSELLSGRNSCGECSTLNSSLVQDVLKIYVFVLQQLQSSGHERHLIEKLRASARSLSLQNFSCSEHRAEFQERISNLIVQTAIEKFCIIVNRYLNE